MKQKLIRTALWITRILVCVVFISLLNLATEWILHQANSKELYNWANKIAVFFYEQLYLNDRNGKIILFLAFFLSLVYIYISENIFLNEEKDFFQIVLFDFTNYSAAIAIWLMGLYASYWCLHLIQIIYTLTIQTPFVFGWEIAFSPDFIKIPINRFLLPDSSVEIIVFGIPISILFLLALKASFQNRANNKSRILTFASRWFLLYILPFVFVTFYPVVLFWLDKLPDQFQAMQRSGLIGPVNIIYQTLSLLFFVGLLYTIGIIIKRIRIRRRILLKEEIKKELIEEWKNREP